mmetsp:Transcript_27791/g.60758  ORF Transcript_27791/g.60758 Transcript_27791/m.60758 type:complete len:194 (-) Transcript_27791:18-599(-)
MISLWRGSMSAMRILQSANAHGGCGRLASTSSVRLRDLQRGTIIIRGGHYCEVRSARLAGSGRSAGFYEVRLRELDTRKAREARLAETTTMEVVDCDRTEMQVAYVDMDAKRLVLADADFNEVEVPLDRLGLAAFLVGSGDKVSLWTHEGNLVKVVPPPAVADQVEAEAKKARRDQLQARKAAKLEASKRSKD